MGNCAAEIQSIARILTKEKLCLDTSPLTIGYQKGNCRVEKLKFNIKDIPRNTNPSLNLLEIFLDVTYKESKNANIPISDYCFRVTAKGTNQENKKFISSWHLDYDNKDNQEYIHPHFHITWGGERVKDLNLGDVLLSPTPRISHPPMDIILGIDFVLSNFVKAEIYKRIQSDSQYKAAIKNAQEKYWKPYVLSIAYHWCNNKCSQVNYDAIKASCFYPTLI